MRPRQRIPMEGLTADWNHPTEIRFGVGRLNEIGECAWKLGICEPLLVTDRNVAKLPVVRQILEATSAACITAGLFSQITGEPEGAAVTAGVRCFLAGRHDGVIAVGGGSALDAAKAIALGVSVGPRRIWGYRYGHRPDHPPARPIPPLIAVPTTAGTGSEVDGNAVITDNDSQMKVSIYHPDLLPRIVIADPLLTRRLIPFLTATTGMDALSHNLEALCCPRFHPILDAVALQGIRYLHDWLPVAVRQGRNLQARVFTMAASIMGAIAFEKGLGAMHAVSHAVGAEFKVHHGRAVGAVMPYVLKHNRRRIETKMAEVARYLDLSPVGFQAVYDWIVDLRLTLGLPANLGELGIRREHVPALAEKAMQDGNLETNPVPVDRPGMERLIRTAIGGR